jgi:hypothetical protein
MARHKAVCERCLGPLTGESGRNGLTVYVRDYEKMTVARDSVLLCTNCRKGFLDWLTRKEKSDEPTRKMG